jgi:RNA polymerase sigma-70 factor (ECF subfamily)
MVKHSHLDSVTDQELLGYIRDGCPDCFTLLFHRYSRHVFATAQTLLRDRYEAEDILQEVFLAVYLQQESFDSSRGSVRTWILQFAYFKSLLRRRYLRIRNFYKQEEMQEAYGVRLSAQLSERFGLNEPEWARFVDRGVRTLTEKQRRTIELVHVERYTLQETADAQGETLANTRNYYYRGLKSLRTFLNTSPDGKETQEVRLLHRNGALRFDS